MAGGRWSLWLITLVGVMMSAYSDSGVYHQLEYDFSEEQAAGAIVGNVRTDARLGLDALPTDVLATVRFTQRQRNAFFSQSVGQSVSQCEAWVRPSRPSVHPAAEERVLRGRRDVGRHHEHATRRP